LVNDQLDTRFFFMNLFQFSTCFDQPRAHHQENQLYQYNLWYMSLCVGYRHRVTYTRGCIDTTDSPDDEHEVARNIIIIIIIIIIFIICSWVVTRWQWLIYMYTNMKKKVPRKFKSGGLYERHVVATWKLGNHLSIRL